MSGVTTGLRCEKRDEVIIVVEKGGCQKKNAKRRRPNIYIVVL
jgi:hypothetical protein